MAQRGIREYDAKRMIAGNISKYSRDILLPSRLFLVSSERDLENLRRQSWVKREKLVVKPDQLFGGRGKAGLIRMNISHAAAAKFIKGRMNRSVTVKGHRGKLTDFLVEPYIEHKEEYFLCMAMERERDVIYFSKGGGVDVEANWEGVRKIYVGVMDSADRIDILKDVGNMVPSDERKKFADFIKAMYRFFVDFGFTYMEINPFTVSKGKFAILDMVAKLDDTSAFENSHKWGHIRFPKSFGGVSTRDEAYIKSLDEKSGASLKLTILNPEGRLWTMVAGGGASVVYADTVSDMGYAKELANYGEYSGNPKEDETFEYAKTIIELMTKKPHPKGKALIIGGGIANFTDVANTFKGIIRAIRMNADKLRKQKIRIYVRRGGPNYREGLRRMKELGNDTRIPIYVYGPEMHMTGIVPLAIKYLNGGK